MEGVGFLASAALLRHELRGLGKSMDVSGFTVSNPDFDLPMCHGSYDPESGAVSIHLEILLGPKRIPELGALGVKEPLRVVVDEEGTMDFLSGRIIQTHAQKFRIPWKLPEGVIEVRAGQKTCDAVGDLLVSVAGSGYKQLVPPAPV